MANKTVVTPAFGTGLTCFTPSNATSVSSDGLTNGDSILQHSLPTLLLQILAIYTISRFLYFVLRPLHQPRIVCNLLAGALLGPSVPLLWKPGGFWSESFWASKLFPNTQKQILRTLSIYGQMYHIFIVGVKMDPRLMTRPHRHALIMSAGSIALPLIVTTFTALTVRKKMYDGIPEGEFLKYLPGPLSTTAFPTLGDTLGEIHLLNSELGRLSMSATMFNNFIGWLFVPFVSAAGLSEASGVGTGTTANVFRTVFALVGMLVLVVFVFRPWVVRVARLTPKGAPVREGQVLVIMIIVMLAGLYGDLSGFSFLIGPVSLGLAVPSGPPLGSMLVQRTDAAVTEVLLPLFFVIVGQHMNLRAILQMPTTEDWARLMGMLLVILLSYTATLVGTMASALYCKIPISEAFLLGLIMNFKGVLDVTAYLYFASLRLVDPPSFTLLMICTMLVSGICVPAVEILYKPLSSSKTSGWRTVQRLKPHEELRVLACVQNEDPTNILTNLIEVSGNEGRPVCAYVLHLVELVGASHSSLIAHKNKKGFINPTRMDPLLNAFIVFEQQKKGQVAVLPFTTVAPYKTMYQDVCSLAAEKDVAMIIVPFPHRDAQGGGMAEADQAVRGIVSDVLSNAPCSVGMLVYHSVASPLMPSTGQFRQRVGAFFWGGADDREALAYASRMARHASIGLMVTQFVPTVDRRGEEERQLDDRALEEFILEHSGNERVVVEEVVVKDMEETLAAIRSMDRGYELLLVGKRQGSSSMLEEGLEEWSEWKELGIIGDMLASAEFDCTFSMLVVQQHY